MNQDLGLRVLAQLMHWSDDRARHEFAWLKLMARLKYDGYRDFQAGMRFVETLATWLQQFDQEHRETAYGFIRHTLVYIGPNEMQRLVEQFYPRTVHPNLVRIVATEHRIPTYRVLANPDALAATDRLRRQTVFMSLSEGARIDTIRHTNSGLLVNDQLVASTQVDAEKWADMLHHLRRDLADPSARFRLVYLIDDFAGTGTSFLRRDEEKTTWRGKLCRFRDSVQQANAALSNDQLFHPGWELCIHHYVLSALAHDGIDDRLRQSANAFPRDWARATRQSFGMMLRNDLPINTDKRQDDFIELTRVYYDPIICTRHTAVGGVDHLGLGYGGCALPLVLEHNTPNNAIALLWADTTGGDRNGLVAPAMRPLFRRRQRHV